MPRLTHISIHHPRDGQAGRPVDLERCRASVHEPGRGIRFHQCQRKKKVTDAQGLGWCTQHSPAGVSKRRAAEDAKYRAYQLKGLVEGAQRSVGREFMAVMEETSDSLVAGAAAAKRYQQYLRERAELEKGKE